MSTTTIEQPPQALNFNVKNPNSIVYETRLKLRGAEVYFLIITPEEALNILEHKNLNNRKVDKNRVNRYLADMNAGNWCFNGDAIRFDKTGNLIDGQHRLAAISKQKAGFAFLVIEGVEDKSRRTIDTGKVRTGGDILTMFSGVKPRDSGVISSAITKFLLYQKGLMLQPGSGSMHITSTSMIEEFYAANLDSLHESNDIVSNFIDRHAMVLSRADGLFLHYIFKQIDTKEAEVFMKKLLTGANVEIQSNEYLMRSILLKRSMKTLKILPSDMLYTVIKAWNRNRKGGVYTTDFNLRYGSRDEGGYPMAK